MLTRGSLDVRQVSVSSLFEELVPIEVGGVF